MTNQIIKTSLLLTTLLFSLSFNNDDNKETHHYENSIFKCTYQTNQGRLNGEYCSWYKNGKKKAQGKFDNNNRIGIWTAWDSTGNTIVQREYETPFSIKVITQIPYTLPIDTIMLHYSLKYNRDGYIDYFPIEEKMIVWTKRIWREITATNNPILFENDKLFNLLNSNIKSKNITPFSIADDEFRNELTSTPDASSLKVIGFKIKEDFFIDNVRQVSETRIIGICPVATNKTTHDTTDLYWIYMPELRKCLAKEKLELKGLPEKIKTVDDLFFFCYFYGAIYKESNYRDKPLAGYTAASEVKKEVERIEISMIESEHDTWMSFRK